MSLREARDEKKFDKRLITRNLRRGVISEQELNAELAALSDSAGLLWNAAQVETHAPVAIDDDEDDEE